MRTSDALIAYSHEWQSCKCMCDFIPAAVPVTPKPRLKEHPEACKLAGRLPGVRPAKKRGQDHRIYEYGSFGCITVFVAEV
jgi:hypothetical protein